MEHNLEEYKYINNQIASHQRLIFQIFTFSIIVSVALLGYGLQSFFVTEEKISKFAPFVILVPMAIIVPCAFLVSAIREDIFRWGAYVMVFHESDKAPGYETRLNKIRDKKHPLKESYTSIAWSYLVLAIVCEVLFVKGIMLTQQHYGWFILVAFTLGFLIMAIRMFCMIPSRKNRDRVRKEWLEVKRQENRHTD